MFSGVKTRQTRRRIPIIGVTGGIGSGKSSVAACFADWGATVISGDEIGHRVVANSAPLRRRLAREFGADILSAGAINRTLLAQRAFASARKTLALNRVVHPALIRELNRAIRHARKDPAARAVVVDAALLVEWGIGLICRDYLVGVWAPYRIRVNRLRRRGLTHRQIRQFSRAQMPWSQKRTYCDFVVKNNGSLSILRRQARLYWEKMLSSDRDSR